jgi:hypothetical protein
MRSVSVKGCSVPGIGTAFVSTTSHATPGRAASSAPCSPRAPWGHATAGGAAALRDLERPAGDAAGVSPHALAKPLQPAREYADTIGRQRGVRRIVDVDRGHFIAASSEPDRA